MQVDTEAQVSTLTLPPTFTFHDHLLLPLAAAAHLGNPQPTSPSPPLPPTPHPLVAILAQSVGRRRRGRLLTNDVRGYTNRNVD